MSRRRRDLSPCYVTFHPKRFVAATLMLDLEARGFLMTVFSEMWKSVGYVGVEHIHKVLRYQMRRQRIDRLLEHLVYDGLLYVENGVVYLGERSEGIVSRAHLDDDIRAEAGRGLKPICSYCGAIEDLQLDHIWPASRGGTNHIDNLTFACRRCNLEKRDKLPHQWRN